MTPSTTATIELDPWVPIPQWSANAVDIGALAKNVFCEDGDNVEEKLGNIEPDEGLTEEDIVRAFAES